MNLFARLTSGLVLAVMACASPAFAVDDIHQAVRRNDLEAVRALVKADPGVLKDRSTDQTPLHEAACYVTPEMVKLLIELGADVNATAYNQFTPLHVVKDAESAKILIKAGADVTKVDAWGKTPLQEASRTVAEAMIEAGAKIDLTTAVRLKKKDLVKKILADDPNAAKSSDGGSDLHGSTSPLGLAAGQGDVEIVQLLLKAGAPIDQGTYMPNAGGNATPLCNAVWAGHTEVVKLLLDNGASTNVVGGKFFDSLLDYALKRSKPEIIELLIAHGAAKTPGMMRTSPLATAAAGGDLQIVELVLKYEAATFTAEDRRRALFLAALYRRDDVAKYLLEQGTVADLFTSALLGDADAVRKELDRDPTLVNAHDKIIDRSLLAWSVLAERENIVRLLLDRNANVNETTSCPFAEEQLFEMATPRANAGTTWYAKQSETPLSIAVGSERRARSPVSTRIVRMLLEKGANAGVESGLPAMSALANAVHLRNAEVVKDLIAHKADVNATDELGTSVLLWAIDSPEIAKLLLDAGADANATDHEGRTMLEAALDWRAPEVAELLVAHGAKLTMRAACMLGKSDFVRDAIKATPGLVEPFNDSRFKESPLLLAAANGRAETVRVLLDGGAKVDYADLQGYMPITRAAENGDVATIALLLDRGASLSANGHPGTALHAAARNGRLDAVKFLLDHKAGVNVESDAGITPLDFCAETGSGEVADVLIAHGASMSHRSRIGGLTPLHLAAEYGNVSVVKSLLKNGADRSARDADGQTPLDLAKRAVVRTDRDKVANVTQVIQILSESAK